MTAIFRRNPFNFAFKAHATAARQPIRLFTKAEVTQRPWRANNVKCDFKTLSDRITQKTGKVHHNVSAASRRRLRRNRGFPFAATAPK